MATKLFLRSTQNNGIGATYYDMVAAAGSVTDTAVVDTAASGTEIQWTKTAGGAVAQWISGRVPAGGFTLTTTDISIWAHESNMNANAGGRYRVFRRTAGGTETEIGGGPFNDGVEFTPTTPTEMTWAGNVTDQAFSEDDRILLKVYITNVGTMASGHTCTLTFNGADAATGDSFFNIAETVTFKEEPINKTPPVGGLSLAGFAPSVVITTILQPAAAALAAVGLAATVATASIVTPPAGAATFSGQAPAVVQESPVVVPSVALTATGFAPTVDVSTSGDNITPPAGSASLTGQVPTTQLETGVTPPAGGLTVSGQIPTLKTEAFIAPGAGSLATTGAAPSARVETFTTPPTGSAVLTGFAPTIDVASPGQTNITPPAGAAAVTGQAPTIQTSVIPPIGAVTLSGLSPTVVQVIAITPPAGTLGLAGQVPTVPREDFITPLAGALVLTGWAPGGLAASGPPTTIDAYPVRETATTYPSRQTLTTLPDRETATVYPGGR